MKFFEINELNKSFGGLTALSEIEFSVGTGEIVGIIGPNGAGKTTLFNCITGFLKLDSGSILFEGNNIENKKPYQIVNLGLARTWQLLKPFLGMSVIEAMMVPCYSKRAKRINSSVKSQRSICTKILKDMGLEKARTDVDDLNQGELRLLDIGRALVTSPKILLLDEPFSGLAHREIEYISRLILSLNKMGLTVVIIEHRLRELMKLVHKVVVINFGQQIAEGTPEEIVKDQRVVESYLGKGGLTLAWLEIDELKAFYHGVCVLHGVSLNMEKGAFVSVIGSNGAGKSTLLRSISRLISTEGEIRFEGNNLTHLKPREIIKKGIIHCPEERHLFPNMTVYQNLLMGAFVRKNVKKIAEDLDHVFEAFPHLFDRKNQKAGTLSGGEQQMLTVGRAMMGNPRLLILDEPSFGLAPVIVDTVFSVIKNLNDTGLSILLVEQNASLALEFSRFSYVLEEGKIIRQGNSKDLINDSFVVEAYLGMK